MENIIKAAQVIRAGGLVAFPTETVYGLGADFFNEEAVKKLARIKNRPPEKPFTVHIADINDMDRFLCDCPEFSEELIEKFWPGPLTLIFNTKKAGKLGFRLPNDNAARELIRKSETLLAAPSANISGRPAPTNAQAVMAQLKDRIDIVLDAGETSLGKESTIIDFTFFPYKIIREGAISKKVLAEAEFNFWKDKISSTIEKILFICTGNSCRSVMAEGYLKKRLKEIERDDIEVSSRGTHASTFMSPTAETLNVLGEINVDMKRHVSKTVSDKDIKEADLILVMEEPHRDEVLYIMPSKRDRTYLLAEFGLWGGKVQNTALEVPDPIGRPIRVYKDTFGIIKNSIERLVNVLT